MAEFFEKDFKTENGIGKNYKHDPEYKAFAIYLKSKGYWSNYKGHW